MTEICRATSANYDAGAARDKMTDEDRLESLRTVQSQYRQAARGEHIACATCKEKLIPLHMYRCWFCGKYFCPQCSHIHFGNRF